MRTLIFTLLMMFAPPTLACSCAQWSMLDAITDSKAIFIAKIIKSNYAKTEPFEGAFEHFGKLIEAKYKVTHVVKGPVEKQGVMFSTGPQEAACSVGFIEGERYFVYLNESRLITYCNGTKHISRIIDEERRMIGDRPF